MSVERRRIRYAAFAITSASLGLVGIFGEACGGTFSPEGAAGNAGSGDAGAMAGTTGGGGSAGGAAGIGGGGRGTTGGTGGSGGGGGLGGSGGRAGSAGAGGTAGQGGRAGAAGTAGKAGSGGAGGEDAGRLDGSLDAPDFDADTVCRALRSDAGPACVDACICGQCAASAVTCFSHPGCRALFECAQSHGCTDQSCTLAMCQPELAEAGSSGIVAASAFGSCFFSRCNSTCGSDAGAADATPIPTDTSSGG